MLLPLISQDPDEVLDYTKDWTDELAGDTISTSDWSVSPAATLSGQGGSGAIRTCKVSALTGARRYTLRNTVVTDGGRTYQTEWFIWSEAR